MSDLAALSADQLAEKVRDSLGGSDYAPTDRRWEDVAADAEAALAELQTRANLFENQKTNVKALYRQRRAAEKERDEALDAVGSANLNMEAAETRLAKTQKALNDACDVAIWMSGASAFGPEGEAVEGWTEKGGARDRLYEALAAIRPNPEHKGSCRVNYAEGICTCGVGQP